MDLPPATACPPPTARLCLAEVQGRFEREAVRGAFDTGRYRCNYFAWGSGPPLLFVPGLSDGGRSFLLPISLLADRFRCVAYDLPRGRGDGARLGRYAHADLVADLFALLDHLRLRQSYLLGSSYGATIALAAMHRQPERLPRAVLQGAFACRPLAPAERLLVRLARYWPGAMRRLPFRQAVRRRGHHRPFADRPAEFWQFFLSQTGAPPIAAVARHAWLLHQVDLRPVLAEVRQPVLLVGGDCDPLVGRSCEEELRRGLPNARRVEVPGCGHYPMYSHPEVLAELVRRFLTPPGAAANCELHS